MPPQSSLLTLADGPGDQSGGVPRLQKLGSADVLEVLVDDLEACGAQASESSRAIDHERLHEWVRSASAC